MQGLAKYCGCELEEDEPFVHNCASHNPLCRELVITNASPHFPRSNPGVFLCLLVFSSPSKNSKLFATTANTVVIKGCWAPTHPTNPAHACCELVINALVRSNAATDNTLGKYTTLPLHHVQPKLTSFFV